MKSVNSLRELSSNENKIINLVFDELYIKYKRPYSLMTMTKEKTKEIALYTISLFDKNYIDYLSNINLFAITDSQYDYITCLSFKNKISNNTIKSIKIPFNLSCISPIWLGHEYIHSLKDKEHEEFYNSFLVSEVIPLFYEILITNSNLNYLHDAWKDNRLYLLKNAKDNYIILKKSYDNGSNKYSLNQIMNYYGKYLISYYYAVNLYHLYLNNNDEIINKVKKVLNNKITSIDLLYDLGLYKINSNNEKIFRMDSKFI